MEQAKIIFIITTIIGLIVASIILPKIVDYVNIMEPHFAISGFQDMNPASAQEVNRTLERQSIQQEPSSLIRKAMCGNQVCPEGSFCDDLSQTCTSVYPSSEAPDEGYYA